MTDFYKRVPKQLGANLRYRLELRRRAAADEGFRRAMWSACKRDVLFWLSAWVWLYEPRPRFDAHGSLLPKQIPFVPWDHQEPLILEVRENLGIKDICIEKSRGEGMSWIGVLMALHDWLFDDMAKVGLVSNTEKKADDPGNMDSLMAKIDWELTKLPAWMAGKKDVDWKRNLNDHSLVNLRNGAQINAFAATTDAGRAGRYKWFLCDELGFWDRPQDDKFVQGIRSSTDSRLIISTPNGAEGAYYNFMHTPSNALRLQMHWTKNNSKNPGLYKFKDGKPVAVDPVNNPLPADYNPPSREVLDRFSRLRLKGFKLEGVLRSPWYDSECDRGDATPQSVAQELDLDYGGSTYRIFTADFNEVVEATIRPPVLRGIFGYHPETLEPDFEVSEDGPVLLWEQLDIRNEPSRECLYTLGVDLSTGLGGSMTSNSVVEVFNQTTQEQVLEFATNTIPPVDFADLCIALAKWFHNACLGWERNGPGQAFTKRMIERRYGNVYKRTVQHKQTKRRTKELGWWTSPHTKEVLMGSFSRAVRRDGLRINSKSLLKECGEYIRSKGSIVHVGAAKSEDDSSVGEAHGDRVIAAAVAWQVMKERPLPAQFEVANRTPPPNSLAARQREYEESLKQEDDVWDDRSNWELVHAA